VIKGEVVVDDREERGAGYKLSEAELLGYPFVIVIGKETKKNGTVEIRSRGSPYYVI